MKFIKANGMKTPLTKEFLTKQSQHYLEIEGYMSTLTHGITKNTVLTLYHNVRNAATTYF